MSTVILSSFQPKHKHSPPKPKSPDHSKSSRSPPLVKVLVTNKSSPQFKSIAVAVDCHLVEQTLNLWTVVVPPSRQLLFALLHYLGNSIPLWSLHQLLCSLSQPFLVTVLLFILFILVNCNFFCGFLLWGSI